MISKSARARILIASVGVCVSFWFAQFCVGDDDKQPGAFTNRQAIDISSLTNTPFASTNVALRTTLERIAEGKERFGRPDVVVASDELKQKAMTVKRLMKQTGSYEQASKPQTMQEAIAFLVGNVNMACLPGKCFEYDGVYYFSGGTSIERITDFSSGFAIRKGESKIYTWSPSESEKGHDDKGNSK